MHISALPGQIAPNVLLPGDPLRARYIAETYLENPVLVNEIRCNWGYTGTYRGIPVTVMATGMGAPSMMIYATELIREYGCKRLIRIGTGGGIREDLQPGDIVLSQAISTTSALNDYALPGRFSPIADFSLLDRAYHLARERALPVHVGNTLCNDHLYVEDKLQYSQQWEKYGLLCSEQEGVALYTAANRYGAKALMLVSIVMNLYRPAESLPDSVKESGLDQMITLALDTVTGE